PTPESKPLPSTSAEGHAREARLPGLPRPKCGALRANIAKSRHFAEKCPICGTFDTLVNTAPGAFTPSASCRVHPRPVGEEGLFKVGDKVVYPHHGAGTIVKKEKRI